jgi:hypothetical protein
MKKVRNGVANAATLGPAIRLCSVIRVHAWLCINIMAIETTLMDQLFQFIFDGPGL